MILCTVNSAISSPFIDSVIFLSLAQLRMKCLVQELKIENSNRNISINDSLRHINTVASCWFLCIMLLPVLLCSCLDFVMGWVLLGGVWLSLCPLRWVWKNVFLRYVPDSCMSYKLCFYTTYSASVNMCCMKYNCKWILFSINLKPHVSAHLISQHSLFVETRGLINLETSFLGDRIVSDMSTILQFEWKPYY